jgi:hypothetical protein
MSMKTLDGPNPRRKAATLALLALTLSLLGGCASMGVQPWERDVLAQPAMAPEGVPLHGDLDDHVYFSKEAATGGRGFGGGGCGCN